jgi:hypothetical protein
MRLAQFEAWSFDALNSYLLDLRRAEESGVNILEEKYINMMAETDPDLYVKLAETHGELHGEVKELVAGIMALLMRQTAALFRRYPCITSRGRPLNARENELDATSIETYQRGELLTYSQSTLKALLAHINALALRDISFVENILLNSIRFYGFNTLDEAESFARSWHFTDSCEVADAPYSHQILSGFKEDCLQ